MKRKSADFLFKLGIAIALPLSGYACYLNGAEPKPPHKTEPVVIVSPAPKHAKHEIELDIEELYEEDIAEEMYYDDLEYLACCVEAEAGNQPKLGKQLVVDVILNRVDHDRYPDSIREVIEQSGQFAVVRNGSIDRAEPSAVTWQAVTEEINDRVNDEVLFFQTGGYSAYGTAWQKVGEHYFSTEKEGSE